MRTNVSGRRVAFTLIELLVALTIIVALTMLCMPAIGPMMNVSSVDSGASIVRAGLMRARHSAVAQQREGFCWLAEGSVVESGVISSVVGGSAVDITLDNDDGSGITISGAWTPSSSNSARIGSNYLHDGNAGKGAKSVQYTPTITTAGSYEVSTWVIGYSGGANNTPIDITHADGTDVVTIDHKLQGGDWRTLGTYNFDAGTTGSVTIKNNGTTEHVLADAVRFTGGGADAPSKTFQDSNRPSSWTSNMWSDYYVVVGAKDATTGDITKVVSRIASNDQNTITADDVLQNADGEALTAGSRYVIHKGDPDAPEGQQTVGSGTSDPDGGKEIASWNKLPEGAAVSSFDADTDGDGADDDTCSNCGLPAIGYLNNNRCPHCDQLGTTTSIANRRGVFPVVFTNKGRARQKHTPVTIKDYITIKIYSSEHPHDANLWRYVRLYRNSGRVAIARKLSDLN